MGFAFACVKEPKPECRFLIFIREHEEHADIVGDRMSDVRMDAQTLTRRMLLFCQEQRAARLASAMVTYSNYDRSCRILSVATSNYEQHRLHPSETNIY